MRIAELDNFLTSVQEVVRVTQSEVKPTIKPIQEKTEPHKKIKQVEPPTELVETDNNETKVLSKEDENKLGAFSGLMESFGAILDEPPEIEDEDALKLQVQDIYPPSKPEIDENSKIKALEGLFSKLSEIKPQPKIVEKTKPEIIEKIITSVAKSTVAIFPYRGIQESLNHFFTNSILILFLSLVLPKIRCTIQPVILAINIESITPETPISKKSTKIKTDGIFMDSEIRWA